MGQRLVGLVAVALAAWHVGACSGKKAKSKPAIPAADEPDPAAQSDPSAEPATDTTTAAADTAAKAPPKTTERFRPKHTPPDFSVPLPGAIAIPTAVAELNLEDPDGDATSTTGDPGVDSLPDLDEAPVIQVPTSDESHGISELSFQAAAIKTRLQAYSRELSVLDAVLDAHADDCFDADGCALPAARAPFTQEMANKVGADLGGVFGALDVATLDQLVGGEITLGDVHVAPTTEPGFNWAISINTVQGSSLTIKFEKRQADGKTSFPRVYIGEESSGSWFDYPSDGESDSILHSYKVRYKVQFDADARSMVIDDDNSLDGTRYRNRFFFLADPDSERHGASFSVDISTEGPEGDGSIAQISGYADDAGAYLRTLYSFDNLSNKLTLSSLPTPMVIYDIYPSGTVAANLPTDPATDPSLGGFSVSDEQVSKSITNAWYEGPVGAAFPADGMLLITTSYDDATGSITHKDTGIKVTAVTQSAERTVGGYTEAYRIDDGAVAGAVEFCYYEFAPETLRWPATAGDGACTEDWDKVGSGTYAKRFAANVGAGDVPRLGQVEVGIGGPVAWQDLRGADLYLLASSADAAAAVTAINAAWASDSNGDDAGAWSKIIGAADFIGLEGVDYAGQSLTSLYRFSVWTTAAAIADAKLAKLVFDPATGAAKLRLVSYAKLVARRVDADNATASIDALISSTAPVPAATPAGCSAATQLYDLDEQSCRLPAAAEKSTFDDCIATTGQIVLERAGQLSCEAI